MPSRREHDLTTLGIAFAAIILFVGTAGVVLPNLAQAWRGEAPSLDVALTNALLLNIALILLGVAGIGAAVARFPLLLEVLRFGGAGFLAVYGLMAARRAWSGGGGLGAGADIRADWRRTLLICLAFTFLNPHVYLDTMVLLGSLSTRYPGDARWVFAAGACLASVSWFTTLGFGARWLQPWFAHARAWRWLDAGIAVFMLALSLLLLLRPLQ